MEFRYFEEISGCRFELVVYSKKFIVIRPSINAQKALGMTSALPARKAKQPGTYLQYKDRMLCKVALTIPPEKPLSSPIRELAKDILLFLKNA